MNFVFGQRARIAAGSSTGQPTHRRRCACACVSSSVTGRPIITGMIVPVLKVTDTSYSLMSLQKREAENQSTCTSSQPAAIANGPPNTM